jgi:hypothetical protein
MKLVVTRVITGGEHIDRSKNLSAHFFDVVEGVDDEGNASDMKITYKKKQKLIMGKEVVIDFDSQNRDYSNDALPHKLGPSKICEKDTCK